jgi:hypothetical protein
VATEEKGKKEKGVGKGGKGKGVGSLILGFAGVPEGVGMTPVPNATPSAPASSRGHRAPRDGRSSATPSTPHRFRRRSRSRSNWTGAGRATDQAREDTSRGRPPFAASATDCTCLRRAAGNHFTATLSDPQRIRV